MNRIIFTPVFIFLFILFSFAGEFTTDESALKDCGTSKIQDFDVVKFLQDLKINNPAEYHSLLVADSSMRIFNSRSTEQQMFWAFNFVTLQYYQVSATLRKTGTHSKIWVEDDSWSQGYVQQSEVDSIFQAMEILSGEKSIKPDQGIFAIDTSLFGKPPDFDGDKITDILILNIKDSFNSQTGNLAYIAGYFSPNDQTTNATSNQRDLIYLDSYPGVYFDNDYHVGNALPSVAHEFAHLICYNYDQDETHWVEEGFARLAETYCGYGISLPYLYLNNTNQPLKQWSGSLADYARVGLWSLYAGDRFGIDFIKTWAQNPDSGAVAFNTALISSGYSQLTFNEVFNDWTIANIVNNRDFDLRYGYLHPDAIGLRAETSRVISEYPDTLSMVLQSYGADYFQLRGSKLLELKFILHLPTASLVRLNSPEAEVVPFSSDYLQYPDFNELDEFILVVNNVNAVTECELSARALYSLPEYEQKYDDGSAELYLTFNEIAAMNFISPRDSLKLKYIRFYNPFPNSRFRLHLYKVDLNGDPGDEIIPPVEVYAPFGQKWVNVHSGKFPQNLNKGSAFFTGIETLSENSYIAYDETPLLGKRRSYYRYNNVWHPLNEFQVNGTRLTGNWMIRAVFEGKLKVNYQFISIQEPQNATLWEVGNEYEILWDRGVELSPIEIELWEENSFNRLIAENLVNNGKYAWLIPHTIGSGFHYQVKITSRLDSSLYAFSNYFEIRNNATNFTFSVYPNPSLGNIVLDTEVNGAGELMVEIYNILGQKIDQKKYIITQSGKHKIAQWNSQFSTGNNLASGMYFYRAKFKNFNNSDIFYSPPQKLILIR